tara:strand:+ start:1370 stop:2044 length:675 start_codon:yes stop_codon:yes gene_type:complete
MADPTLAVLLRNGPHDSATIRYALKCNDVAVSYARTPMQIPIAQSSPELIDLGFMRPSLTVTGTCDTVGQDHSNYGHNATTGREIYKGTSGMTSFTYIRPKRSIGSGVNAYNDGGADLPKTYFVPYKNALEEAVGTWMYAEGDTQLQVEMGDATYPIASFDGYLDPYFASSGSRFISESTGYQATGGAIYDVAIQQGRFSMTAAKEDRYDFTLQFVIKRRIDIN